MKQEDVKDNERGKGKGKKKKEKSSTKQRVTLQNTQNRKKIYRDNVQSGGDLTSVPRSRWVCKCCNKVVCDPKTGRDCYDRHIMMEKECEGGNEHLKQCSRHKKVVHSNHFD